MIQRLAVAVFLFTVAIVFSSCSKFFGGLRKDLDDPTAYDQPTVGGVWPEGRLLDEPYQDDPNYYRNVGHSEERPSWQDQYPSSYASPERERSWVNSESQAAQTRDHLRGQVAYSDTQNFGRTPKRKYRAKADDFRDRSQSEGSLWASNGQTNYFFTKNRIRSDGDILKVKIEDPLLNDIAIETKRTLSEGEREMEVESLQAKYDAEAEEANQNRKPAAKGKEAAEPEAEAKEASFADVDVKENMGVKSGDTILVEILDRYPNGNYKIRGTKRVPYRGSARTLMMLGVARHADVDDQDTIASGKLYEYRLQVYR